MNNAHRKRTVIKGHINFQFKLCKDFRDHFLCFRKHVHDIKHIVLGTTTPQRTHNSKLSEIGLLADQVQQPCFGEKNPYMGGMLQIFRVPYSEFAIISVIFV